MLTLQNSPTIAAAAGPTGADRGASRAYASPFANRSGGSASSDTKQPYPTRAMALNAIDPFNVKRVLERVGRAREELAAATDLGFLMNARRALFPLPIVDRPEPVPSDVLPPFTRRPAPGLKGKRVAVVGSGGSGACVTLVGVARAVAGAEIPPAAISACSGAGGW